MFNSVGDRTNWSLRHLLLAASVALIVPSTACNKQDAASTVQAGPTTFSSPEEAGKALAAAQRPRIRMNSSESSAPVLPTSFPRVTRSKTRLPLVDSPRLTRQ